MPDLNDVYGKFDMNEKMDEMESTCCSQSMRVWVIICNIILLLLAIASFGIGIYIQNQPGFAWTASSIGVGLILVGVFMLLLAVLGGVSAWLSSKCLFGIYGTLLLIFFIAQLAALIVAIIATSVLVEGAARTWDTLDTDHKHGVGMFFGCCSVDADSDKGAKYAKDTATPPTTYTTCENPDNAATWPESTPGKAETFTQWTGECTVFGVDYKKDGDEEVKYVSFPEYSANYLAAGNVCAPKTASKADYDTCSKVKATGQLTTEAVCKQNTNCAWKSTGECKRPEKEALKKATEKYDIPSQCLCPIGDDKLGAKNCRTRLGAIPSCDTTNLTTFPFVAGVSDAFVNIEINAGAAACYAKLEVFLSENMAAMGIIAFIFVYQLVLLIFSFALCCCVGKKSADETATDV